ncbi:exopolysaccharide Pel transporter PelG [Paenibacillus elgii]
MAGIGFELKKLFRQAGLLHSVKAYAYSSLTTIGPMILCLFMLLFMQRFMSWYDVSFLERELFQATIVYGFIFSTLLTGGLSMILTRFIADKMYMKQYEYLLSSYYGAMAVSLPVGMICAWLFLRGVPAGFGYKAAAYLFFAELIILSFQGVLLSAVKDFKRIVRNYCFGIGVALAGAWLVLKYTPFQDATAALTMLAAGFLVIVLLTGRHLEQTLPAKESRLYFDFLSYLRKYPALFLIGTLFYSGVYIHSFVYWFGPAGERIAEQFAVSNFFDPPVFYAYLTVTPTLITFVVSVETAFYEKFRDYYSNILNEGTLLDIARAKEEMQRTLTREVSFMMEVQLLFTVLSLALGLKLLPAIGFSMEQLDAYVMLVLGYFLFIVAFIIMLILLYFDDRKGVLVISSLFVFLNVILTSWTMAANYHGIGLFVAAFLTLAAALWRLVHYVGNIEYYTFCAQPLATPRKAPFWRRRPGKMAASSLLLLGVGLLLGACSNEAPASPVPAEPAPVAESAVPGSPLTAKGLVEDKRLYERDNDTSVAALYMTVLPDKKERGLSWYSLNRIRNWMEEGDLKVILQEGAADGSGPQSGLFGYGATETNAKVSLRGNTTRYSPQRSYKIRLNNQAGLWREQRTIDLNKHYYDSARIRNKLSFDIFETLPHMASLRTQFVHLYVKDLSGGGNANAPYEDYGLFTQIEHPNEMFLKNHWLDPNGQLYKAVMFEFFRYPETLRSQSDPKYDKQAFEKQLEIKGREDHDKLLMMLNDVNNMAIPINEVMEKHFDLDNYLTWLASNILMDNMDTDAQNFLLYSPLNSDKWYFIPWDYDGGWELQRGLRSISDYSNGISNYWGSVLHNRFFRSEENVQKLKNKIDELYQSINKETVTKRVDAYRGTVEPFLKSDPDIRFLPVKADQLDQEFDRIAEVPARSLQRFKEDLEKPKPFYLGDLQRENGKTVFVWDQSFDLQGDDLVYDWTLAKDPLFTQIVAQQKNMKETTVTLDALQPGEYYWKVIVRDQKGNQQIAFDMYRDTRNLPYYGMRQIKVE